MSCCQLPSEPSWVIFEPVPVRGWMESSKFPPYHPYISIRLYAGCLTLFINKVVLWLPLRGDHPGKLGVIETFLPNLHWVVLWLFWGWVVAFLSRPIFVNQWCIYIFILIIYQTLMIIILLVSVLMIDLTLLTHDLTKKSEFLLLILKSKKSIITWSNKVNPTSWTDTYWKFIVYFLNLITYSWAIQIRG